MCVTAAQARTARGGAAGMSPPLWAQIRAPKGTVMEHLGQEQRGRLGVLVPSQTSCHFVREE